MWALVWLQLVSGSQIEYFHIANYSTSVECKQKEKVAQVMVNDSSIAVVCLNLRLPEKEE